MKLGGFPEQIWRRRWLRALALLAALTLLATIDWPQRLPFPGPGEAPLIYTPVALAADDPGRRDVGRLHFLGGWTLGSPDSRLGGLSSLRIEGNQATALSDAGVVVTFPLPGASPAPRARFQPVVQGPGGQANRRTRDTEGLWLEGNRLWISFERSNAVWRYDRALNVQTGAQPARMRRWRRNSGPETLVGLADGRFLVMEEGRDNGSTASDAILFAGDPAVPGTLSATLTYQRPPGYRATDAALLPDGRLLILNRGLAALQLSAKLVLADPRNLRPGGTLAGEEIATLAAPLVVDNLEGIAVTQEHGRIIVWLVSDDDFMRLFRNTLLLKFELRL